MGPSSSSPSNAEARSEDPTGPDWLRWGAAAIVAVSVLRVLWIASLHEALPVAAEASDLHRVLRYHSALRGYGEDGWWGVLAADGYKPPLWYGGTAAVWAGRASIGFPHVVGLNALWLAGLAAATSALAARIAPSSLRRWAAPIAAVLTVTVAGVAGRYTMALVEPMHATLFAALLTALHRARAGGRGGATAVAVLLGLGMLAKWNFALYAAGPMAWEVGRAVRRGDRRAAGTLVTAALAAGCLFAAWLVPFGDIARIAAGATSEVTHPGDRLSALAFYPRELARALGWGVPVLLAAAVAAALLPAARPRGEDAGLLAAAVAAVVLPHVFIPHQEARYLLPALPPLLLMAAVPFAGLVAHRGRRWLPLVLLPASVHVLPLPANHWGLRMHPEPAAPGMQQLVAHPGFGAGERANRVAFLVDPADPVGSRLALGWGLYAASTPPCVEHSVHTGTVPGAAELAGATLAMALRPIGEGEEERLREAGFERLLSDLRLGPGLPAADVWVRAEGPPMGPRGDR